MRSQLSQARCNKFFEAKAEALCLLFASIGSGYMLAG